MPIVYITGVSGSGKSTIYHELKRRGFAAFDSDDDGMSAWYNRKTGQPIEWQDTAENRTTAWYDAHEFKINRSRIEALANEAKNKTVYLVGQSLNECELADLFAHTICLTLDEKTLKHRLATRTGNDYGKAPDELARILGYYQEIEARNRNQGAIMIDAAQPLDMIIDQVLQAS